MCDIIILVWNQLKYTKECLESILAHTKISYRIILVDNASEPETKEYLEGFRDSHPDRVVLIRNERNLGFVGGTTQGFKASTAAPYVCLLNNDTIVADGWLENMIDIFKADPKIGLMNPTWQGEPGKTPDECARILSKNKGRYLEVNECIGFCMLVRREVVGKIGYLDPVFDMGGLDDSDYSRRVVQAGYRCARAKGAYVFHWENTSLNLVKGWREDRQEKTKLFEAKWGKSKQLAFIIVENEADPKTSLSQLQECLSLARQGNKVHCLIQAGGKSRLRDAQWLFSQGIAEHNNIRYLYFYNKSLFAWNCFFILLGRRFKKEIHRVQEVFSTDKTICRFLNTLQFLHRVEIITQRT